MSNQEESPIYTPPANEGGSASNIGKDGIDKTHQDTGDAASMYNLHGASVFGNYPPSSWH